MQEKFESFRKQYPVFIYKDYHIFVKDGEYVELTYDFEVSGLCEFHPSNRIRTSNLEIINDPESETARHLAFSLGMVELVSYWKPMCSPNVEVLCGALSEAESEWWKKLYFGGLGEFFFKNGIRTTPSDFMTIKSAGASDDADDSKCNDSNSNDVSCGCGDSDSNDGGSCDFSDRNDVNCGCGDSNGSDSSCDDSFGEVPKLSKVALASGQRDACPPKPFKNAHIKIIPIGGGKDSCVTMELTREFADKVFCFTVNDQPAREESAACAGYTDARMIRTYRTLDKNMLELNARGFLNGHTPFSAIVAFLSAYCGYLLGAEQIILSNESSANEGNLSEKTEFEVNHQYSKSYEFEKDFSSYLERSIGVPIKYFSLLRSFNELQIAKQFSAYKKYHSVFRSCNAGSKKNIWCDNCAKCLFVYTILSPFLTEDEMTGIFGENLLARGDLKEIFDGLVGFSEIKPFECVGTHVEINAALKETAERYIAEGRRLPVLLEYYYDRVPHENGTFKELLCEFNRENDIPEEFFSAVDKMYNYVKEV
mgnify:FL=1